MKVLLNTLLQIAESVGNEEPVRSFETRIPADKVPRWGAEAADQVTAGLDSGRLMTIASVAATVACLAGKLSCRELVQSPTMQGVDSSP